VYLKLCETFFLTTISENGQKSSNLVYVERIGRKMINSEGLRINIILRGQLTAQARELEQLGFAMVVS
jgi:hypothetical protein